VGQKEDNLWTSFRSMPSKGFFMSLKGLNRQIQTADNTSFRIRITSVPAGRQPFAPCVPPLFLCGLCSSTISSYILEFGGKSDADRYIHITRAQWTPSVLLAFDFPLIENRQHVTNSPRGPGGVLNCRRGQCYTREDGQDFAESCGSAAMLLYAAYFLHYGFGAYLPVYRS